MRQRLRIKPRMNRYLVVYEGEGGLSGRGITKGRSVSKKDIEKAEETISKIQGKKCIITGIYKL